jgi:hypothetical protein
MPFDHPRRQLVQACRSAVRTPLPKLRRPPPVLFQTHECAFLVIASAHETCVKLWLGWSPAALGLEPSCTPTRTLLCKPYLITLPALELDAVDNGAAAKRFCEEQRFLVCFAKMDR